MRSQTLRKPLALLLSFALALGGVPTQALAESLEALEGATEAVEAVQVQSEGDAESAENVTDPAPAKESASEPQDPADGVVPAEGEANQSDSSSAAPTDAELAPQTSAAVGDTGSWTDEDVVEGVDIIYSYEVIAVDDISLTPKVDIAITSADVRVPDGAQQSDYYGAIDANIPSTIDGYTVTTLKMPSRDCFRTIHVPATVDSIEPNWEQSYGPSTTFGGSRYLEELTFDPNCQITTIPDWFFYCSGIKRIALPDSVMTIGNDAFNSCIRLTDVTLPAQLTDIGDYAFYNTNLTEVTLPNRLKTIGNYAFSKGSADTSQGWYYISNDQLDWAGDSFVKDVIQLSSISIPDSVVSVGNYAFANDSITYNQAIDVGEWETRSNIATITLGSGVQSIGEGAFQGSLITTIELPSSLKTIGQNAFAGSGYLGTVTWQNLAGSRLETLNGFNSCVALGRIDIPNGVTTIGKAAFSDCVSLTEADIPASTEAIDDYAFDGCVNLSGRLVLPGAVSWVGSCAFARTAITSLAILPGTAELSFGAGTFKDCTGLDGSTITLIDRVSAIAGDTFDGPSDVTYYIYNDALRIDKIEDMTTTTFSWNFDEGDEGYDEDYGEWASTGTSTQYGSGGMQQVGYKNVSVPNPWGGGQGSAERAATPMDDSVVYYPETVTRDTSLSFWCFLKVYEQEWDLWQERSVRYYINPESYAHVKFIWPEFRTFNATEPVPVEPSGAGTLQVSCEGDAGMDANVCVFNAEGTLVASEQATAGFALIDGLGAGAYTVAAFANNAYFSSVGSLEDFSTMGLADGDYAKKEGVAVTEDRAAKVELTVPALSITQASDLLESSSVIISKKSVPKGVELFATINFAMADDVTANTLVVSIPAGLEVTSVASGNKNYGTSGFNNSTRKLTLSLDESDAHMGRVWVGLKATSVGTYSINATVVSDMKAAPLGSAMLTCAGVTLDLPTGTIQGNSFDVTVKAEPGATVKVETSEQTYQFGPTNRAGTYTGTIELGDYGTMGINMVGVYASVEDGDAIYSASGTVTVQIYQVDNNPKLQEFYFVHAEHRVDLVRDGWKCRPSYYTYMAFGNDKPKYKYWTFSATFTSPIEMTGTTTTQVQMLDGSSRFQEMTLTDQHQQDDGTWLAHYATTMFIEQAGNHVFDKPSLIPCAFDAIYSAEPNENVKDIEVGQRELQAIKSASSQDQASWLAAARALVGDSYDEEVLNKDEDEDFTWCMFHSYRDDPELQSAYNKLPAEGKQMFDDTEAELTSSITGMEKLVGFNTTSRDCEDVTDYITKNLHYQEGQGFDIAALEAEGYELVTDESLTGMGNGPGGYTIPVQYAMRVNYDREGNPVSMSYADSTGVRADLDFSQMLKDNDYQALGDTASSLSNACAGSYVAIEARKAYLNGNVVMGLLTQGEYDAIAKYLNTAGTTFTYAGFVTGCIQGYTLSMELPQCEDEVAACEGTIDNLKIWEDEARRHMERYGLNCANAIAMQRQAAESLLRTLKLKRYNQYSDTVRTYVFAGMGLLTGGVGTVALLGASTITSMISSSCKASVARALIKKIEDFEHWTNFRNMNCRGAAQAKYHVPPIMDPSGIVYEGVESNTLEGVTATVVDLTTGEPWDAEAYDQVNPQVTGPDGVYQWDVLSGNWKVTFTKDGYLPAETDALEVPPPHLGIAVPMISTAAPQAVSANADPDHIEIVFDQYMDSDVDCEVSVNGTPVDASSLRFADPEEGVDGKQLSRVLCVPVPAGTKLGDTLSVTVSGAKNYAGTDMDDAEHFDLTVTQRPARIEFNFEETISLQVGVTRPTTVRVYDGQGNPIKGLRLLASLDNDYLATVDDANAVTDADGAAKLQLEALLPGMSELTVGIEGHSLTRTIALLTTVDANQAARPTVKLGATVIGEGAPLENHLSVSMGELLVLNCATEGATIYYTTDGSCPCQDTPGRREYTGPVSITENTNFIIAAYKDGMDYSDKVHVNVTVGSWPFIDVNEQTPHAYDICWLSAAGISTGWDVGNGSREFRGREDVLRQDMAAFLYRLAGSPAFVPTPQQAAAFVDVDSTNPDVNQRTPHYNEILWLAAAGVSEGWELPGGKREFRGREKVQRQDMAAFLRRLAGHEGADASMSDGASNPFYDVDTTNPVEGDRTPHYEDIVWLANTGVTTGWDEDGGRKSFRGGSFVLRQDMAAFLHRLDTYIKEHPAA